MGNNRYWIIQQWYKREKEETKNENKQQIPHTNNQHHPNSTTQEPTTPQF